MATSLNWLKLKSQNLTQPSYGIFRDTTTNGVTETETLMEFDTIDECSVSGSATATKYPSELGTNITDYKYSNPDQVKIVGILSEGGVANFASIFSKAGLNGKRTWDRATAIANIRTQLDTLCRNMQLVNIQTRNGGYRQSLTLVGYTINETYDNYGTMEVEMTFQQIQQFNASGQFVRNVSDGPTIDGGIANVIPLVAGGLSIATGTLGANYAALR